MPGPVDKSSGVGAYDRIVGQHGAKSTWSSGNSQTFRADPETGFKNLYVHAKKSRWALSSKYRSNRREKKINGAQLIKDALDKQFGSRAGEKVFRHIQSRSFRGRRNLDREVTRGDLHKINDALAKLGLRQSYQADGSPKLPDAPKTFVKYIERMQRTGRIRANGTQVFKLIKQDYGKDMAETLFSSILGDDFKTGQTPRMMLKPEDVMKMRGELFERDTLSELFEHRLGSKAGANEYISYDVKTGRFAKDGPDVARSRQEPAIYRKRRAAGVKIWQMVKNEVGADAADKIFADVFGRAGRRNAPVTYGDVDRIYAHMQAEKLQSADRWKVNGDSDANSLKNSYQTLIGLATSGVIDRERFHDYERLFRVDPERAATALIQEMEAAYSLADNAPEPPDLIEHLMMAHTARSNKAATMLRRAFFPGWRRTQQAGLASACARIVMDGNGKFSLERAKRMAETLAMGDVPGTLIPETDKVSEHTRHMIRVLTLMCDDRSFRKVFDSIGPPIGRENPTRDIIRKTLGLPADAEVTSVHARQAALGTLLGNLRQAKTGSCFATSLAINVIKNDPKRVLKELKQLIELGRMVIIHDKKFDVPISRDTSAAEAKQSIRLDGDGMLVEADGKELPNKIPFYEMPPMAAALTAMGIPKSEHAATVKEACTDYIDQPTTPDTILRRIAMVRHGLTPDHFEALEQIRDLQHQAQQADWSGDEDGARKYWNQRNLVIDTLQIRALEAAVESGAVEYGFNKEKKEEARQAIEETLRDDIKEDVKQDIGQTEGSPNDKVQRITLSNGRTALKYDGQYYMLANKNSADSVEIRGPLAIKGLFRTEDVNATNDMLTRGIDGFQATVDNRLLRAWEYTIADLVLVADGRNNKVSERQIAGLGGDERDSKSVLPPKDLPLLPYMERQFFIWKEQPRSAENEFAGLANDADRPQADKVGYRRFVKKADRRRYAKNMRLTDEGVFLMKFQDRVRDRFIKSLERRFVSVYDADKDSARKSGFALYDTRNSTRRENWRRIDTAEAYQTLAASVLTDAARGAVADIQGKGKLPKNIADYLSKVVDHTVSHVLSPDYAEVARKAVERHDTRLGGAYKGLPWQKADGGPIAIHRMYIGYYGPKIIGTAVDANTPAEDRGKSAHILCHDLALFLIKNRETYSEYQKSRNTNIQLHVDSPAHDFNICLQTKGVAKNAGAIADAWKFDKSKVEKTELGPQVSREIAAKAYATLGPGGRIDDGMDFSGLTVVQVIDKVCRGHMRAAISRSAFRDAMINRAQAHIWMNSTLITPGREMARTKMSVNDQRALVTGMLTALGLSNPQDPAAQDLLNAITEPQTPPQLAKLIIDTLKANRDYVAKQHDDPDWADRVAANLACAMTEPPPHVLVADSNREADGFAASYAFMYNPFSNVVECREFDEIGRIARIGKSTSDVTSKGIWIISDEQPKVA